MVSKWSILSWTAVLAVSALVIWKYGAKIGSGIGQGLGGAFGATLAGIPTGFTQAVGSTFAYDPNNPFDSTINSWYKSLTQFLSGGLGQQAPQAGNQPAPTPNNPNPTQQQPLTSPTQASGQALASAIFINSDPNQNNYQAYLARANAQVSAYLKQGGSLNYMNSNNPSWVKLANLLSQESLQH